MILIAIAVIILTTCVSFICAVFAGFISWLIFEGLSLLIPLEIFQEYSLPLSIGIASIVFIRTMWSFYYDIEECNPNKKRIVENSNIKPPT